MSSEQEVLATEDRANGFVIILKYCEQITRWPIYKEYYLRLTCN